MRHRIMSAVLGFCIASFGPPASAQNELVLIAPRGIRGAIEQLLPAFERQTGQKVHAEFVSGGEVTARVVKASRSTS